MTDQPKRVVKDVKQNPCGCKLTEFEDGGKLYHPCPPCGIFQSAEELQDASRVLSRWWPFGRRRKAAMHVQRAAMAFAAVATTLQGEQQEALRRQQLAEILTSAQRAANDEDDGILPGPGSEK